MPYSSDSHLTFERTYRASVKDIWELWTTKSGIESWWGPGGFAVTVHKLDLRPGGELLYVMTAIHPQQIEFMRKAGMPLTTEARMVFTEIVPRKRLAYYHVADFIPGVEPYDVAHVVELHPSPDGLVRMVVTIEKMHDDEWTRRAAAGWESELAKLDALLASHPRLSKEQ
ncbi:SRPBCC domain-containing protein [Methylovirgula sp. 4M-Z18]|nr:SRPBCC domain-containing protein [Methylovirgula sp. 4M-Z18]